MTNDESNLNVLIVNIQRGAWFVVSRADWDLRKGRGGEGLRGQISELRVQIAELRFQSSEGRKIRIRIRIRIKIGIEIGIGIFRGNGGGEWRGAGVSGAWDACGVREGREATGNAAGLRLPYFVGEGLSQGQSAPAVVQGRSLGWS
jgi:hypothetical protein